MYDNAVQNYTIVKLIQTNLRGKNIIMRDLKGRVVMITGASSGFGELTARAVVAEGGKVVLGARREDRLRVLVDELGQDNAVHCVTDVTKAEDLKTLAKTGIETFGHIDALINNAGSNGVSGRLAFLSEGMTDDWEQMIDVNVKGVLYGISAVASHMLERGHGSIINISSVAGLRTNPGMTVYCATKSAVRVISEGLRQETAGKLQVTSICPGVFDTEMVASITDEVVGDLFRNNAEPPERVVDAILFALKQDPAVSVTELVIQPINPVA